MKLIHFLSILSIAIFVSSGCNKKPDAPTLTSIKPVVGPAGTLVTIEGTNLADITSVTFSGQPVNFNTAFNSDVALLMRISGEIPVGDHEVVVTTEGGSFTTNFKITLDAPQVYRVLPEFASPGETVSIYGKNFFPPLEVYFFDSLQAQIVGTMADSIIKVVVPAGTRKGKITVVCNGQDTLSPNVFYTQTPILVNDFDGNGIRSQTNKWIFVGTVDQTAQNAVQNTSPTPINNNFLKLTGKDNLNITWIGGAQSNFGFPGDTFETYGITSAPENTLLQMDMNNNGKNKTHVLFVLQEKNGSTNDFTHKIPVNWSGWRKLSIPLSRFSDLNGIGVDPTKVKIIKIHLIDEEDANATLEVNVDNLEFLQIF
jgi:hypothetical protein